MVDPERGTGLTTGPFLLPGMPTQFVGSDGDRFPLVG